MSALAKMWFVHLVHSTWQATIVAAFVLVATGALRKASPRLRQALLAIALAKFALPPMLPLPVGLFRLAAPVAESPLAVAPLRWAARYGLSSAFEVLMLVHAAGAAFVTIRLVRSWLRLQRLRRSATAIGRCDAAPIFVSREVDVPVSFGIVRRAIVLPQTLAGSLTAEELWDVVEHEAMHLRRQDVVSNALEALLGVVWWFHPLFRQVVRESRAAREECCDDAVIAAGVDVVRYVRTLAAAAKVVRPLSPLVAAIAETPHSLVARIRRLSAPQFAPSRRLGFAAVVLLLAFAALVLPGVRLSHDNHVAFDPATMRALHAR